MTVTALGRALRSRPRGKRPSRVVALWKDRSRRKMDKIELPRDKTAVVLKLRARMTKEWTADGRHDKKGAGSIELFKVRYI